MRITRKLVFVFSLGLMLTLLAGCDHDISKCNSYARELLAIRQLLTTFDSQVLILYPAIWSIVLVRKLFFV